MVEDLGGDTRGRPVAGAEPEKPSPIPSAAAQQPDVALCFGLWACVASKMGVAQDPATVVNDGIFLLSPL